MADISKNNNPDTEEGIENATPQLNVVSKQNTAPAPLPDSRGTFLERMKRRGPTVPSLEEIDSNNNVTTATTQTNGSETAVAGNGDDAVTIPSSYAEQIKEIEYQKSLLNTPTKEEQEAEAKRQKRNAMFAAISDGISALSNLYFTTKGAPNAYTGRRTMTDAVQDQYAKIRQDWQDNLTKSNALGMQKFQLEKSMEQEKLRQRQAKQAMELKYQEFLLKADEAEKKGNLILAQQYKEMAIAAKNNADKEYKEEQKKWVGPTAGSEINKNNASAAASYASAQNSRASAGQHEAQTAKIYDDIKNGGNVKSITLHDGMSGTTATVNIPKSKWNMTNVSKLYWLLGGRKKTVKPAEGTPGTSFYKPAVQKTPTMAEMEAYIGENLQIGNKKMAKQIANALNYIKGLQQE